MRIQDAMNLNKLDIRFNGIENFDSTHVFQDYSDVYFGKSIELTIVNNDSDSYLITGGIGMNLMCSDTSVQNMLITRNLHCLVQPNQTIRTKIYAMCMEYHDNMPNKNSTFLLESVKGERLIRLADYISNNELQNIIGQCAVWILTDEVDFGMVQKYGATSNHFDEAIRILAKLESKEGTSSSEHPIDFMNEFNNWRFFMFSLVLNIVLFIIVIRKRYNMSKIMNNNINSSGNPT